LLELTLLRLQPGARFRARLFCAPLDAGSHRFEWRIWVAGYPTGEWIMASSHNGIECAPLRFTVK